MVVVLPTSERDKAVLVFKRNWFMRLLGFKDKHVRVYRVYTLWFNEDQSGMPDLRHQDMLNAAMPRKH